MDIDMRLYIAKLVWFHWLYGKFSYGLPDHVWQHLELILEQMSVALFINDDSLIFD